MDAPPKILKKFSILSMNILLMLDLIPASRIKSDVNPISYQRILRKVYVFFISLNMKLQLYFRVLIIVTQVRIISHH